MEKGAKELLKEHGVCPRSLFLLDMDGTIYNDNVLFDKVKDFLRFVAAGGGRYIFVTNNSSRSVQDYVKKLGLMGIKAREEDFFTSSMATVLFLKERYPNKKVFCIGTESFVCELKQSGVCAVTDAEDGADIVLAAFDTELTYKKLYDASRLLQQGKTFLATNCDRGCPVSFGLIPDCGAICETLYFATNRRPKYIGKPEPDMILYALQKAGYTKENTVVVGDRLYTDIASGINAGVKTILVLSGETTPETLSVSEIKPDMVLKDIGELYEGMKEEWN